MLVNINESKGSILFFTHNEKKLPNWVVECNIYGFGVLVESIKDFMEDKEEVFLDLLEESISLIIIEDDIEKISFELYKKLRKEEKFKKIPIVFLGEFYNEAKLEVMEMGAIDYFKETINSKELVLKIKNIVSIYNEYVNSLIYDTLTGTYTVSYGKKLLNKERDISKKDKSKLSILIVDIDDLSSINKKIGKLAGNDVIKKITSILMDRIELRDFIFRVAGGKFLMAFPNKASLYVLKLGDEIANEVRKLSNEFNTEISITGNVRELQEEEDILKIALIELLKFKKKERGKVYLSDKNIELNLKSILIINEDKEFLKIIKKRYKNKDFNVYTANDVETLQKILSLHLIDIVITEFILPGMTGVEIIREVKNANKDTKILVFTLQKSEALIDRAFNEGADDFLSRPASPIELDARINKLLQKR
ncbi:response regulator [Clostridium sp. 'White wine YQ']|uniref:response regulator n=1 Tax=Clostridium sp. 'White wine YQ' TaxID=3027474 RepID=UPI002366DFD6|nr:response regulator [Clostridium sp. 'White wine YQ']MDD7794169.1 response regulator [Clostridium sp. 'White wine YQ']